MEKEIDNLSTKIDNKSIVIIGGAKISTKINMINKYLGHASHILIGGAMAYTFLKAQGKNIGLSIYEKNMVSIANDILNNATFKGTNIVLPDDFVCSKYKSKNSFDIFSSDDIGDDYIGYDIGPETSMNYSMIIFGKTLGYNNTLPPFISVWSVNIIFLLFGTILYFKART